MTQVVASLYSSITLLELLLTHLEKVHSTGLTYNHHLQLTFTFVKHLQYRPLEPTQVKAII
jgi:hypothetical protein